MLSTILRWEWYFKFIAILTNIKVKSHGPILWALTT